MAFENLLIRTKRTIGGIQLDSVLVEEHNTSITPTKNPVEVGVDITDHAIIDPTILSITGVVSDSPLGTAAFGQLIDSISSLFGTSTSENLTRSQQAYDAMLTLMYAREPIEVTTKLKVYTNMLITNVSVSQDKDTSRIANMNLSLEEVIITESESISLTEGDVASSIGKSITGTIDKGRQETKAVVEKSKSILKSIGGWLGG